MLQVKSTSKRVHPGPCHVPFEFAHLASYNHVGTHPFILQLLELASRDLETRPRVSAEDGPTELSFGLDSVPWPGAPSSSPA